MRREQAARVASNFAFATPICTPIRAELLTGQYPFRRMDRLDLRRRTILGFTADSGTSPLVASSRQGERIVGGKGKMNDQGFCVPLIVNGPAVQSGAAAKREWQ